MPRSRRTRDMRDSIPGTSKNPNFVVILRCSEIFIAYISKYMLRSKICEHPLRGLPAYPTASRPFDCAGGWPALQ